MEGKELADQADEILAVIAQKMANLNNTMKLIKKAKRHALKYEEFCETGEGRCPMYDHRFNFVEAIDKAYYSLVATPEDYTYHRIITAVNTRDREWVRTITFKYDEVLAKECSEVVTHMGIPDGIPSKKETEKSDSK